MKINKKEINKGYDFGFDIGVGATALLTGFVSIFSILINLERIITGVFSIALIINGLIFLTRGMDKRKEIMRKKKNGKRKV